MIIFDEKMRRIEWIPDGRANGLQGRIDATRTRNEAVVAAWLDRVRLAAVASPLVFLLTAGVWAVL